MRRSPLLSLLALVVSFVAAASLWADTPAQAEKAKPEKANSDKEAAAAPKFLRLTRDKQGTVTGLETAVVRYVPKDGDRDGLSVDLIGAVHIADKGYYDQLNKAFEEYDVLLYELVAPEGVQIKKGSTGSGHPIALLQNAMKDVLGLEHQLACVDYQKKNFVHADMSPEQFSKSMAAKGENIWTMVIRLLGVGLARQSGSAESSTSDTDLLMALFDKNRTLALKRILAEQFEDMDDVMAAFEGPGGSTLIAERNKTALAVLSKQIKAGKKRIGIFYGAGHLADMEQRLATDFNLKRADEHWLTAWDLSNKKSK